MINNPVAVNSHAVGYLNPSWSFLNSEITVIAFGEKRNLELNSDLSGVQIQLAGVGSAAGALAELRGELPLRPRTGRRPPGANLRLNMLANSPEPADVPRQQRERNSEQVVLGVVARLLGDRRDVHLEAHVALEHGRPGRAPLVLHPERHRARHRMTQFRDLQRPEKTLESIFED